MWLKILYYTLPFLLPSLSFADAGSYYNVSDYTKAQLELFQSLSGKYSNSRGDKLEVVFEYVQADEADLFGPKEFWSLGTFENTKYESFEFDLKSLQTLPENAYAFSSYENDCDNPGCSNYEARFVFKKNRDGKFYVNVDAEFIIDSEEVAYIFEEIRDEGLSEKETENYLEAECRNSYGKTAWLSYFAEKSSGTATVYCGYKVISYLKKD